MNCSVSKQLNIQQFFPIVLGMALLIPSFCTGCGGPAIERIKVNASNDPLEQPRALLKKYADGQRLGSEVTMFDSMVDEVKKNDPQRGKILEEGLKALQSASAGDVATQAAELLTKLQPSMTTGN